MCEYTAENLCYGSYTLNKEMLLENICFSQCSQKKTFYKTSRTCVLKTFIILFNSLFVFFVGHCLLTYSGRLHPEAKIKTFP